MSMIPHLGWVELTLIFVIVAMLFGVGKLPEVFGAVGKGVREFRKEATTADKQAAAAKVEQPAETTTES
jgi:sec-independent protein translocase protein TatA